MKKKLLNYSDIFCHDIFSRVARLFVSMLFVSGLFLGRHNLHATLAVEHKEIIQKAVNYYKNQEFKTSLTLLLPLLKETQHGDIYYSLGNCWVALDNPGQAIINYKKAYELYDQTCSYSYQNVALSLAEVISSTFDYLHGKPKDTSVQEVIQLLKPIADPDKENSTQAQTELGSLYHWCAAASDTLIEKAAYTKKSVIYYSHAAYKNDLTGLFHLACIYQDPPLKPVNIPLDNTEAIELYKAKLGNIPDCLVRPKYLEAQEFYQRIINFMTQPDQYVSVLNDSNQKVVLAKIYTNLGRMYAEQLADKEHDKDQRQKLYTQAFNYYQLAIKLESSYGSYDMGLLYLKKDAHIGDTSLCVGYFENALKSGITKAHLNLGAYYQEQLAVFPKDTRLPVLIRTHYQAAFESQNSNESMLWWLLVAYRDGIGGKKDPVKYKIIQDKINLITQNKLSDTTEQDKKELYKKISDLAPMMTKVIPNQQELELKKIEKKVTFSDDILTQEYYPDDQPVVLKASTQLDKTEQIILHDTRTPEQRAAYRIFKSTFDRYQEDLENLMIINNQEDSLKIRINMAQLLRSISTILPPDQKISLIDREIETLLQPLVDEPVSYAPAQYLLGAWYHTQSKSSLYTYQQQDMLLKQAIILFKCAAQKNHILSLYTLTNLSSYDVAYACYNAIIQAADINNINNNTLLNYAEKQAVKHSGEALAAFYTVHEDYQKADYYLTLAQQYGTNLPILKAHITQHITQDTKLQSV